MARIWRTWGVLAGGIAIGLAIGGALALGVACGQWGRTAAGPNFGDLPLRAMAAHGNDNFAIATGTVDDEVEGLYTLDFLTGDLQCFVVNPRNGALGGWFKTNVAKDLQMDAGNKKANFLLVTGTIQTQGYSGNQRPAGSLCYVIDGNTGNAAAYSFPWGKSMIAQGVPQSTPMVTVGKWKTRSVGVREQ